MTLAKGTAEAQKLSSAPHWRRSRGFEAGDLGATLGGLARRVGERGAVGRAFSLKCRRSADPFSAAESSTANERATGLDRVARIRMQDPDATRRLFRLLRKSGIAESCHPVATQMTFGFEDLYAPGLEAAWPGAWAHRLIRAEEAHGLEPGSPDVIVAVLDTGMVLQHREFGRGKLVGGQDFVDIPDPEGLVGDVRQRDSDPSDDAGHGTHVAGIIAAKGLGMDIGVGGACRIMPVRVLGTAREGGQLVGIGVVPDIDDGIKFAVDSGADVINLSLGVQGFGSGIPHLRTIQYARRHNVVVVAASGNDGGQTPLFPGAVPGVVTVGAVTELGRVAGFSTWGPQIDVVAPGTAIWSADLGGRYRYPDGHLLEYLAMLPHQPRPEAGVVPYGEWLARWAREVD